MMQPQDVFIKHTDKDGHSWIACHRVWDAILFYDGIAADAVKIGGKSGVELSTEQDYNEARDKRK